MTPTFSVITIAFNSEKTIIKTIESVLSQKNITFEYIIIDGGSTDNTLEIIKSFDNKVKVISEKDKGIYDAMNKGIRYAKGEIISILNSDDIFLYDTVLFDVAVFFNKSDTDAVYSNIQYHDFNTNIIRSWKAGRKGKNSFVFGWMPPHPGLFIKRKVYEQNGLYDYRYAISGDYDLMLRFFYKQEASLEYLDKITVSMLSGGVSNSNIRNKLISMIEDFHACRKNEVPLFFATPILKIFRKISQFYNAQ